MRKPSKNYTTLQKKRIETAIAQKLSAFPWHTSVPRKYTGQQKKHNVMKNMQTNWLSNDNIGHWPLSLDNLQTHSGTGPLSKNVFSIFKIFDCMDHILCEPDPVCVYTDHRNLLRVLPPLVLTPSSPRCVLAKLHRRMTHFRLVPSLQNTSMGPALSSRIFSSTSSRCTDPRYQTVKFL